jgi:hypothetical protein
VKIPLELHNQNDIANYVRASVLELTKRNIPAELKQEIENTIIERSNGMFLWVDLILYDLKTSGKTSPHAMRQKLKALPKASQTYTVKY